ncbi:MAG: amidohydrolase family protein, partial [Lacisediminihabitans sp.]
MIEHTELVLQARHILTPEIVVGAASGESGFVAVRNGVIVAVGASEDAAPWVASADRVIDLDDATVTAGLVDAHIHPVLGLAMARGLDLSGITSWADARRALTAYVAEQESGWILGWGLDPAVFEGRKFDNSLFDGIADGRLVFIVLFDAHSALASQRALEEAGVTGREEFVDSARVSLGDDGRPNGALLELSAQALVQRMLPEQTFDERVDALGRLLAAMAQSGLTGGQMLDLGAEDSFDLLDELERWGDLPIRLRISPWIMPGYVDEDLERMVRLQGRHGRRWHVRGIKLMIDGTIDNGTAWLMQPDTHGESRSSLWLDPGEYARAVAFFHERCIPTTTHAIGDEGISYVARTIGAQPSNGTVHRIE